MAYRKHEPDRILRAAVETALESGFAALTFGAVGRRLGISDRTVVYYFPTKSDLTAAVLQVLGQRLQETISDALGSGRLTPQELLRRSWPVLAAPANDRVFALFFEVVGLASDNSEPYATAVQTLIANWADWLEPRILTRPGQDARSVAFAVLAQVDGLLLLRNIAGAEAATAAAEVLSISCKK
jgi:AcrR family transcriptional regulator